MRTTPQKVRFGIATDEPISGTGMHCVLREREQFRVFWLPASTEQLLRAVPWLSIDVLLIDMVCGFPADIDWQLRDQGLRCPLIRWTRNPIADGTPPRPMEGVSALLDKRAGPEMLLACVKAVLAGRAWADTPLALPVMAEMPAAPTPLSRREAELMDLVSEGMSNRQIAERLRLTPGSVKVYCSRLFRKLGVADRLGLALYSMRQPWEARAVRESVFNAGRGTPRRLPKRTDR